MTVLTDGIFNTRDVQPADYHTKELEKERQRDKPSAGKEGRNVTDGARHLLMFPSLDTYPHVLVVSKKDARKRYDMHAQSWRHAH